MIRSDLTKLHLDLVGKCVSSIQIGIISKGRQQHIPADKCLLGIFVLSEKNANLSGSFSDADELTWQCLMKSAATMKLRTSDPSIIELQN